MSGNGLGSTIVLVNLFHLLAEIGILTWAYFRTREWCFIVLIVSALTALAGWIVLSLPRILDVSISLARFQAGAALNVLHVIVGLSGMVALVLAYVKAPTSR